MNKISTSLLLIFFINLSVVSQELKKEYQDLVLTFINSIKDENIDQLKTLVCFPFRRQYPLADIKNETELENRFKEIFDDSLSSQIINSNVSKDWSKVGWRGIMMDHGLIWLDIDGRLIAVNNLSKKEKKKRDNLIDKDRKSIHKSVRDFDEPELVLETKTTRIRIDIMSNDLYRFASWPINTSMRKKPERIIENGTWMPEGNGGNKKYEFVNGNFKYVCYINNMKADETPPAEVIGYNNEKIIKSQSAKIIRN